MRAPPLRCVGPCGAVRAQMSALASGWCWVSTRPQRLCRDGDTAEELEATRRELEALREERDRLARLHKEKLKRLHDFFHPVWCALAPLSPLWTRRGALAADALRERRHCHLGLNMCCAAAARTLAYMGRESAQHASASAVCRGQMLKTGYQNSMYASLMERFACLYTSHVSNLALYSPYMKFRGRVDVMAHEHGHAADPADAEPSVEREDCTVVSRAPEAATS